MRVILWSVVPPRGEYQQPPSFLIIAVAWLACVTTAALFLRFCIRRRKPIERFETIQETEHVQHCAISEDPAPDPPIVDHEPPQRTRRRDHCQDAAPPITPYLRSYRTGERFISL